MDEKKKIETSLDRDGLREIAKGTIRFSIKADDTLENLQVHSAFKSFCQIETDNNYTLGIRKLLEYYESDAKIGTIFNLLQEQSVALQDLTSSVVEMQKQKKSNKEEDESDAF